MKRPNANFGKSKPLPWVMWCETEDALAAPVDARRLGSTYRWPVVDRLSAELAWYKASLPYTGRVIVS